MRSINMGIQTSIDINFAVTYKPVDVLFALLDSGYSYVIDNEVCFVPTEDFDDFNWQSADPQAFDFKQFVESRQGCEQIGICLSLENDIGVNALIYQEYVILMLSINRQYLSYEHRVPDFSWYLKKLLPFIERVNISSIKCDLVFWCGLNQRLFVQVK